MNGVEPLTFPICNRDALSICTKTSAMKGVEPLILPICNRDALSICTKTSALEGSRTPNLLIRSQVLYPIELQVRQCNRFLKRTAKIGFLFYPL